MTVFAILYFKIVKAANSGTDSSGAYTGLALHARLLFMATIIDCSYSDRSSN